MHITCESAREALWPLDRPRDCGPVEETARRHVSGCDACRAFFLRDAELTRLLRRIRKGLDVPAPDRLRAAVAHTLAAPRPDVRSRLEAQGGQPRPSRRRPWQSLRATGPEIAAAAAAVLLLGGGLTLAGRYQPRTDPDRFAADYVRTAVVQAPEPGIDAATVGPFYQRELGLRIEPVALHDAPLTRATVCDLEGQLGAMVEYDLAGLRLVHYRIPRQEGATAARTRIEVKTRRGVQVAYWDDGTYENALVARASGEYLAWLAESRFSLPAGITKYGSPASRSWRRVATN